MNASCPLVLQEAVESLPEKLETQPSTSDAEQDQQQLEERRLRSALLTYLWTECHTLLTASSRLPVFVRA